VCRSNAIVYLAQKKHSSYGRDSYGLLQKSLHLLYQNYLKQFPHETSVFIFHEGDFHQPDLKFLDSQLPIHGNLHFVNLTHTDYWQIPHWLANDDPTKWRGFKRYSLGYRHMMRWYAIQIWNYFRNLNQQQGCHYRYIMRLDEESFLESPISYNLFDYMAQNDYVYAYRLCSYELGPGMIVWHKYLETFSESAPPTPQRNMVGQGLCGLYNNFFVASLDFMTSPPVQHFLQYVDQAGFVYRKRVNDLVIHSLVVYAFAPPSQIHRFLDFSYQHITMAKKCPFWGAFQTGYADPHGASRLQQWLVENTNLHNCTPYDAVHHPNGYRLQEMTQQDLSPTYAHYPGKFKLFQLAAGSVELKHKGLASG
jgi:alpha 1,2-mannosyltransferase